MVLPLLGFGQLRTKEVTQHYPNSEQIKFHYFYIKSSPELYHGEYQVYFPNGQLSEKGLFEMGEKIFYLTFDRDGKILEELKDSVISEWDYFSTGQVRSVERFKNGVKHGTWETNRIDDCDNQILESSVTFQNGIEVSSKKLANYRFYGIYATYELIQNSEHHLDTTSHESSCFRTLRYPREALRNGIQGKIYVKVELTSDCEFSYELLNDLGYGTTESVVDFMEETKRKFSNRTNCDSTSYTAPINFHMVE
ncbi:MAG: hypothetical protein RIF34_08490 [Candidatus Kapaibacterium sp.]